MQVDNYYKDELTNVYNRRYLYLLLDRELKRIKRYGGIFSIVLLDLDDFKEINDTYGHLAGDRALYAFARVIESSIRESDIAVRYGGDEFLILLPDTDASGAEKVARRIIKITKNTDIGKKQLSCSVGIATYPQDATDWEAIFSHADRGLYAAKRSEKGTIGKVSYREPIIKLPTDRIIGRRQESAWIKERFTDNSKIHFVCGEAGIGKTRLITELARADSLSFARGAAYGALHGMPYFLIKELLKNLYKSYRRETEVAYESLNQGLRSEMRKLLPEVATEIHSAADADKYRLYYAVASLLSEIGREQGIVVLLDDLQWIDEPSSEMLFYLIKMAEGDVTLFGAYRTEEIKNSKMEEIIELLGREDLYDRIEIGPLGKGSVVQMSEAILQAEIDDKLANYLQIESGGNPFFIEEIIKNLKEHKSIEYREDGEWHIKNLSPDYSIAKGIEDVVNRKIRSLDRQEQVVLEYAAVIGKIVDVWLIEATGGIKEGEIYDILDKLVRTGILRETQSGTYEFSEGIIIDVVIRNITKGRLRMMHEKAARVLEKHYIKDIQGHVEEIAYHYHEGNKGKKLGEYARMAGEKSMEIYAYDNAVRYYLWALEGENSTQEQSMIYGELGDAYVSKGAYENAIHAYNMGLKIYPKLAWDFYQKIAYVHYLKGMHHRALQLYKKSKQHANSEEQKNICAIHIASELKEIGKIDEAKDMLLKTIKRLKEKEKLAEAYNIIGNIYSDKQEYKSARRYYLKSIKLKAQSHDMKGLASVYNNLGLSLEQSRSYKKALFYLEKSLEIHREMNYKFAYGITTLNMGLLYYKMKNYEKAMELYQKAADINESIESNSATIIVYNNIGSLKYRLNDLKAAIHYKKKALKIADEVQNYPWAFKLNLRLASIYGEIGKFDEAFLYLNEAKKCLKHVDNVSNEIYYFYTVASIFEMQKKYNEAIEIAKKMLQLSRRRQAKNAVYTLLDVYLSLSRLKALLGDKRRSKMYLTKALNSLLYQNSKGDDRALSDFEIGKIYLYLNDLHCAIKYLKLSEKAFRKLRDLHALEGVKSILKGIKKPKSYDLKGNDASCA